MSTAEELTERLPKNGRFVMAYEDDIIPVSVEVWLDGGSIRHEERLMKFPTMADVRSALDRILNRIGTEAP